MCFVAFRDKSPKVETFRSEAPERREGTAGEVNPRGGIGGSYEGGLSNEGGKH